MAEGLKKACLGMEGKLVTRIGELLSGMAPRAVNMFKTLGKRKRACKKKNCRMWSEGNRGTQKKKRPLTASALRHKELPSCSGRPALSQRNGKKTAKSPTDKSVNEKKIKEKRWNCDKAKRSRPHSRSAGGGTHVQKNEGGCKTTTTCGTTVLTKSTSSHKSSAPAVKAKKSKAPTKMWGQTYEGRTQREVSRSFRS